MTSFIPQNQHSHLKKHLILLGPGHAHLNVLKRFIEQRPKNTDITLISCGHKQWYSGMLPAMMAGFYSPHDICIDVVPLCRLANIQLLEQCVIAIDADKQTVTTEQGDSIHYDVLSINTGAVGNASLLTPSQGLKQQQDLQTGKPSNFANILPIRPLANFVHHWQHLLASINNQQTVDISKEPFHIAIIGAGAGAVELAMATQVACQQAIQKRLSPNNSPKNSPKNSLSGLNNRATIHATIKVSLIAGNAWLPTFNDKLKQRVSGQLSRLKIERQPHRAIALQQIDSQNNNQINSQIAKQINNQNPDDKKASKQDKVQIILDNQQTLTVNAVIIATGISAPEWTQHSGLAVDSAGYIAVNRYQQSTSHANVFAVGDIASHVEQNVAHSGVHSVYGGAVVADNLLAVLDAMSKDTMLKDTMLKDTMLKDTLKPALNPSDVSLRAYQPKARTLYLLSCGDKYAIASWGKYSWQGRWVWYWKQWIDKRFIAKHQA